MASSEQSRFRFEARTPIPVLVQSAGRWRAGEVRNLSPRGAFITLGADVWVGEEIEVILGLPNDAGGRLKLRALTVWRTICEQPGASEVTPGYGLLFQPESDRELVRAIDRLSDTGLLLDTEEDPGDHARG
ncbi:MAG TPA: PilZ domain-containing protein [Vicinamibacteria bacterium]